jgi:transcriptional regulator with XRE-family HTH domain
MYAGTLIREARLRCNLTQAELARRLGMTQTGVAQMEKREKVGSETLEKVAQALGMWLEIRFLPVERSEASPVTAMQAAPKEAARRIGEARRLIADAQRKLRAAAKKLE